MTPSQEKEFVAGFTGQGDVDTDSTSHIPASGKGTGEGAPDAGKGPGSGYESDTAEDFGKVIEVETDGKPQAETGDYGGQEGGKSSQGEQQNVPSKPTSNPKSSSDGNKYQFQNDKEYERHFRRHASEFGFSTKEEYLAGAQTFICSNNPQIEVKFRENGDTLLYLASTNEFAVVTKDDIIRTYFKPSSGRDYFDHL